MAYRVEVTEPAEEDIDETVAYMAKDSFEAALRWHDGLWQLIFSLSDAPTRFSLIEEAEELGFPYRSAIHYSHRVIFRIDDALSTVYVVRVYHGARHPLTRRDIR